MPKLIGTKELCEILGLSRNTIQDMRERRAIPYTRLSARCYRYDPAEVEKALARRTVKAV